MTNKSIAGLVIIILIVIGLIWIGFYYYGMSSSGTSVATTTTPGATVTMTTTPQGGAPVVTTSNSVAPANSTAVVSGTVVPNGAQTSYWYEYGKTTALGAQTAQQEIGSGFSLLNAPAYITGLSPLTLYYFRLDAQNSYGTSVGTTYSFTTNSTVPPQGNAPTTQTNPATSVSRTTANLNGTVQPNGSETSYWFEYGTSTDLGSITDFQSAGNNPTATVHGSLSLSGLQPLTKYYFRLDAQNQYGTINGSILNFTTTGPPGIITVSSTL